MQLLVTLFSNLVFCLFDCVALALLLRPFRPLGNASHFEDCLEILYSQDYLLGVAHELGQGERKEPLLKNVGALEGVCVVF